MMVQAVSISCTSIQKLTSEIGMGIRDCYSIARSIMETALNVAYILASDIEVARRANRHAVQKSFRDLDRSGQVASWRFTLRANLDFEGEKKDEALAEALAEFSDAKGREVRDWTTDNIDARVRSIEKISNRAALYFAGAIMTIYRHSSEILHGTNFGVRFFWTGGMRVPRTKQDAEFNFLSSHFTTVFTSVIFSVRGLLEIIYKRFDLQDMTQALELFDKDFNDYFENSYLHLQPTAVSQ